MKVFLFPGQGSQHIGMGHDLHDSFSCARDVFQEVDEALQQNLTKIMFEGPEENLVLTENAQPALMAVSMAVMRILEKEGGRTLPQMASYVAGHSLGQYAALCAAESLTLSDTARLLKLRGQAMQHAVPLGIGAMAAVLGLDLDVVDKIVKEAAQGEICAIANDNSPGQVVISGHAGAIDRAIELAKAQGAKRSILLNVSAPFHCPLMQPAQDRMADALGEALILDPVIPVIDNVTAQAVHKGDTLRDLLVQQITGRVRWRESLEGMADLGVTTTVEVGAGKVLTGLAKRTVATFNTLTLNTPADIEAFLKTDA